MSFVLDVSASIVVVLTTLPNPEKAAEIARILVEERLAACVNIVPAVRSIYRWQDAIKDETETLASAKTTAAAGRSGRDETARYGRDRDATADWRRHGHGFLDH